MSLNTTITLSSIAQFAKNERKNMLKKKLRSSLNIKLDQPSVDKDTSTGYIFDRKGYKFSRTSKPTSPLR